MCILNIVFLEEKKAISVHLKYNLEECNKLLVYYLADLEKLLTFFINVELIFLFFILYS